MNSKHSFKNIMIRASRELTAIICVAAFVPGNAVAVPTQQPAAPAEQAAAKLPAEQLDSLVAPIALYPDPLLSQTLVASTYPLEVVQLQQWLNQHKDLKDKALADAVKKQDWDPSIQSLAALPDVAKLLADNIKWTTDLGNAFLAQQKSSGSMKQLQHFSGPWHFALAICENFTSWHPFRLWRTSRRMRFPPCGRFLRPRTWMPTRCN